MKKKFEEFWKSATQELSSPKTLLTLKQLKEFQVQFVTGSIVVIPGTNYKRTIAKSEFKKIWNMFRKTLNPYKATSYQKDTYHASYILAIIKYFLKQDEAE